MSSAGGRTGDTAPPRPARARAAHRYKSPDSDTSRTTTTMRAGAVHCSRLLLAAVAILAVLAGHARGIVRRRRGFGDGGQEFGYVDVREGAHMFYWLYYFNGGDSPADRPLVLWLQGGPGASSTSFGNFEEIGPLDSNLNARNSTWVKYVNVMFVDNPVGTGFSYVDSSSKLTTNNKQIASDLVELMRGFLKRHPQFRTIPVYVFSESYGGKMAAEFALNLFKEKKAGTIDVNIQGVALGDAWISPVDTVLSWANYLLQTVSMPSQSPSRDRFRCRHSSLCLSRSQEDFTEGCENAVSLALEESADDECRQQTRSAEDVAVRDGMVDTEGYKAVDRVAQQTQRAMLRGQHAQATLLWSQTELTISRVTQGVSFYNILDRMPTKAHARADNSTVQAPRGARPDRRSPLPLPSAQGMVDRRGHRAVQAAANKSSSAAAAGKWREATRRWEAIEGDVLAATKHADFYNILMPVEAREEEPKAKSATTDFLFRVMSERIAPDERLDALMNSRVKPALGVVPERVRFRTTSAQVFNALYADFMKPVTHIVERLLSETDLKVVVFNGQLDLIVSTPGTLAWAERLKWRSGEYWVTKAPRRALAVDGILEGFVKSAGKFSFYWINRAGHMVPADNPAGSIEMLRQRGSGTQGRVRCRGLHLCTALGESFYRHDLSSSALLPVIATNQSLSRISCRYRHEWKRDSEARAVRCAHRGRGQQWTSATPADNMRASQVVAAAACAVLAVIAAGPGGALARKGFGDGAQEYGYVDVRDGAHMFYWLFYVQPEDRVEGKPWDLPLVIWLQGGPGASSTSYGNFMELGPLDANLKRRNTTWVKHVNVLFIDNPVGTGYSYVDHSSQLVTNNQQIAADLVAFTKTFMKTYPQFQKTPLYVFCESYGGKMTAEFALRLYEEQKAGNVLSNLKGVALGDSWISPIDSVMTWAPYLLHTLKTIEDTGKNIREKNLRYGSFDFVKGPDSLVIRSRMMVCGTVPRIAMNPQGMVDARGFRKLDGVAQQAVRAVRRGRFFEALQLWGRAEAVALEVADNVDFYNIMSRVPEEKASRVRLAARRGHFLGWCRAAPVAVAAAAPRSDPVRSRPRSSADK
ncbi:Retinoid-inducible serine carboxypeptidase [Frankliniella fusca]|uniref:Carboxypeptidase n=1 Tax=Frankliniella fusca TaxID=407009 RepID=A0AAE1HZ11_9NEOP|nr:Retinoid-inducible serine carboxypeptidase [Frankliniella fusca]